MRARTFFDKFNNPFSFKKKSFDNMWCKFSVIVLCILWIHLCDARDLPESSLTSRKLVIIDTDAGGDDAVGILLALAAPEVQVLAITCTYGNTNETNVETNLLKILNVANRTDIPLYGGAKKPLLQKFKASDYFGQDGFGDFQLDQEMIGNIDRSKHASVAMIDLVNKYPGEIHVVVLGPLTNVALAASLHPNFTRNVNRFYVMGSKVDVPKHPLDKMLDFNFSLDPESNAIFLNSTTNFKTLVTSWELAHHNTIEKKWRTEVLGKSNSTLVSFLNKAEASVLKKSSDHWAVADSLAVATMIWPELVTRTEEARMSAHLCTSLRGWVNVDESPSDVVKNVEIIRSLDVAAFKDKLLRHLACFEGFDLGKSFAEERILREPHGVAGASGNLRAEQNIAVITIITYLCDFVIKGNIFF